MNIEKKLIEFSDTGSFSTIFIDYIKGDKKLLSFYQYKPELSSFKQAISEVQKQSYNRPLLVEVIEEQYKISNLSVRSLLDESHHENFRSLTLLLDKNTFTVCTGHQLCLFAGPLYFIYKIITTINLTQELKNAYPQYNFVPVYWMASEDHDFEEVSEVNLFGKKIKWNKPAVNTKQVPVGKLQTETIKTVIEELKPMLGESENAKQLIKLFEDAYLKNKNLADATRCLVHELFGEYGLVIIDTDDTRLKKEFTSIIKDDILNNTNYTLVNSTIQKLAEAGYDAQVKPREINVFYTDESRERIVYENSTFNVLRKDSFEQHSALTFTKTQLEQEIDNHPERFSPNVVLRPLFQQKILPNLGYIGGPAEIAYWLQYKSMFEHHQVPFPVLMPRNSVMWIDENTCQQMKKTGLNTNDLFKSTDLLIKEFLNRNTSEQISFAKEEETLKILYKEIASTAEKIDATLKPTVEAELQKQLNALKNIENKLIKAEKQKHENSINKIKKIKEKLFPNNILQERHDNFMPLFINHGKDLLNNLKKALKASDLKFIAMIENGQKESA